MVVGFEKKATVGHAPDEPPESVRCSSPLALLPLVVCWDSTDSFSKGGGGLGGGVEKKIPRTGIQLFFSGGTPGGGGGTKKIAQKLFPDPKA